MNGYLNNLTMRTLNAGNRVEPRLPALFEPRAFQSGPPVAERIEPFEEEVTTVAEAAPRPAKTEERVSSDASSPRPGVAKSNSEGSPVVTNVVSSVVRSDEDLETRFEPVSHEEEREDPVETLTVQANLQPRTETAEIARPINDAVVETAPIFEEIEERLTPSLEIDDSALLRPTTRSESQNQPVTRHLIPKRNPQGRPAALIPAPETDQYQTQITFPRTTPTNTTESAVAPVELAPTEQISQTEHQVTHKPESETEFESTTHYRRINPTPATWRDTRQQQWRRRQSSAPVEPEPSINVTIGRIEVRAVPADRKTTSPRRSESPVMPLEDYLRKQRRGGER